MRPGQSAPTGIHKATSAKLTNIPLVCTFCGGSLSRMIKTTFIVDCILQEVYCPCYDTFSVSSQHHVEKSMNVCSVDHRPEYVFMENMRLWREHCRSNGCVYVQVHTDGDKGIPMVLFVKNTLYPGKISEPRAAYGAPLGTTFRSGDRPFFLLSQEMTLEQYCYRLVLDKDVYAPNKRHIAVTNPYTWEKRPALVCSLCIGNDTQLIRYPTVGIVWINCVRTIQTCPCKCFRGNENCLRYLPYCDSTDLISLTVKIMKSLCHPECEFFGVQYPELNMTVPLFIDNGLFPSQVISSNGSFLMTEPLRRAEYCSNWAQCQQTVPVTNSSGPVCLTSTLAISGPATLGLMQVPIVCTYCVDGPHSTGTTQFKAACVIQQISCRCSVAGENHTDRSISVCGLDHLTEADSTQKMQQWRQTCLELHCSYTQARDSNGKLYLLYKTRTIEAGRIASSDTGQPPMEFTKAASVDEYCIGKTSLPIDQSTITNKPMLICSACDGQIGIRYPTRPKALECTLKAKRCQCNFGADEGNPCIEYLPYCDAMDTYFPKRLHSQGFKTDISRELTPDVKSAAINQIRTELLNLCKPRCQQFGVYYPELNISIPLGVMDGFIRGASILFPTEVISPNASFLMPEQQPVTDNRYCYNQFRSGLFDIPYQQPITGFLMCTQCKDDDPWTWKVTATWTSCKVEKITCTICDTCKLVRPKPGGDPIPHCLPVCKIQDHTVYQRSLVQCQNIGCQRPQVMYNSDWYLMATTDVIYPGVYKFRLYASHRRVDNITSRANYCRTYDHYTTWPSVDSERCAFSRDFYERPPWNRYGAVMCSSLRRNNKFLCEKASGGSPSQTFGCQNPKVESHVSALGQYNATAKLFGVFQRDYDRYLRLCRKEGYQYTQAALFIRDSTVIATFQIFGTEEIMGDLGS